MNSPKNSGNNRERRGCPPKWKHSETCTIRIPKIFKSLIEEIAKELDEGKEPKFEFDSIQKQYKLKSSRSIHQKRLNLSEVFVYEPGGHKCVRLKELIPALQKYLDEEKD